MLKRFLLSFSFAAAVAGSSFAVETPETPHLAFVKEYVRELVDLERVRESMEKEAAQTKDPNEKLTAFLHGSTLMQLELQTHTAALKEMRLNGEFKELIPRLVDFYTTKSGLYGRFADNTSALLAGSLQPEAGVYYGKLATDLPKLRAQIEYINETLFTDMTPLVFMTLIDMKPDSQNHCSHLTITKAERDELVRTLTDNFGAKLNAKNPIYGVADASLLKFFLIEKGYRCSDEPWL